MEVSMPNLSVWLGTARACFSLAPSLTTMLITLSVVQNGNGFQLIAVLCSVVGNSYANNFPKVISYKRLKLPLLINYFGKVI
jgi:hypothetical protein